MFAKRVLMILSLGAGLACLFSAWTAQNREKTKRVEVAKSVATLEKVLKAKAPSTFVARHQRPGDGSTHGTPVYQVNSIYLSLNMKSRGGEVPADPLIRMAECLRSANEEMVAHCQKLSLYMLSDWVLSRPESEWHSSPVVDEFFRVFKSTRYVKLAEFFERRSINSEQKYLNQI